MTALRAARRDRVTVELDGEEWRMLPAVVVVRAGLSVGRTLDRPVLRLLRRELRRAEALEAAGRALKARDLSSKRLASRLERAAVAPAARREAMSVLEQSGLVDDARFAHNRAAALAHRAFGDAAIRLDLTRHGVGAELREKAVAALESELDRARAVVLRRGEGARTARYLAAKGFGDDALAIAAGAGFASDP